jgi:hypothetical protein
VCLEFVKKIIEVRTPWPITSSSLAWHTEMCLELSITEHIFIYEIMHAVPHRQMKTMQYPIPIELLMLVLIQSASILRVRGWYEGDVRNFGDIAELAAPKLSRH